MSAIPDSVAQGIWVLLAAFMTRGVFLFLLVLLVTRAVPWLSEGVRTALWFGVICALFLLPAARLLLPALTIEGIQLHGPPAAGQVLWAPLSFRETMESTIAGSALLGSTRDSAPGLSLVSFVTCAAYAVGLLICALRPIAAMRALRRLVAGARPLGRQVQAGRTLARRLGIRRPVTLVLHDRVSTAFTFGVLRPCVVFPAESRHWPRDRFRAVLVHELAHIRRGDCLLNWVSYGLCTLAWFLPVAWFARASIRREAEMGCDRCVLEMGFSRPQYASTLLDLAVSRSGQPLLGAAGFFNGGGRIKDRIHRIMSPVAGAPRMALVLAVCLALPVFGSFVSIRESEALFGTWGSRETEDPAVYSWSADGTAREFTAPSVPSESQGGPALPAALPRASGSFVIDREWKDGEQNTWYEVRTQWSSFDAARYTLIRVNATGKGYESIESWGGYPAGFSDPTCTDMHRLCARL